MIQVCDMSLHASVSFLLAFLLRSDASGIYHSVACLKISGCTVATKSMSDLNGDIKSHSILGAIATFVLAYIFSSL